MTGERASKRKGNVQDAASLLSRLEDESATLRVAEGECSLQWASAGRSAVPIAEELVRFCLELDLLEAHGAELTLSATGRSWLRRQEASGDAFRQQHQLRANRLAEIDGARRPVLVNDTESPLGWLKSRKDRKGRPLISGAQFDAGERLRADYWFAQLSPRVTANWSALAPSGRMRRGAPSDAASLRDEVIAAKERVRRAIDAVGPELAGVLVDVCCELKGLEQAEREKGWPQRAGKVVLQLALTRLARHYGIAGHEGSQSRRLRHWGSEGYRPTLEAWRENGT